MTMRVKEMHFQTRQIESAFAAIIENGILPPSDVRNYTSEDVSIVELTLRELNAIAQFAFKVAIPLNSRGHGSDAESCVQWCNHCVSEWKSLAADVLSTPFEDGAKRTVKMDVPKALKLGLIFNSDACGAMQPLAMDWDVHLYAYNANYGSDGSRWNAFIDSDASCTLNPVNRMELPDVAALISKHVHRVARPGAPIEWTGRTEFDLRFDTGFAHLQAEIEDGSGCSDYINYLVTLPSEAEDYAGAISYALKERLEMAAAGRRKLQCIVRFHDAEGVESDGGNLMCEGYVDSLPIDSIANAGCEFSFDAIAPAVDNYIRHRRDMLRFEHPEEFKAGAKWTLHDCHAEADYEDPEDGVRRGTVLIRSYVKEGVASALKEPFAEYFMTLIITGFKDKADAELIRERIDYFNTEAPAGGSDFIAEGNSE